MLVVTSFYQKCGDMSIFLSLFLFAKDIVPYLKIIYGSIMLTGSLKSAEYSFIGLRQ